MLRKLLLVAIGFYLGYKAADGVEIEVVQEDPSFEDKMITLVNEKQRAARQSNNVR